MSYIDHPYNLSFDMNLCCLMCPDIFTTLILVDSHV